MCQKKCIRPSSQLSILAAIFTVVGNDKFRWNELKQDIPDLPRQPPVSLIDTGMLVKRGKEIVPGKGAYQIWTISQDVTHYLLMNKGKGG